MLAGALSGPPPFSGPRCCAAYVAAAAAAGCCSTATATLLSAARIWPAAATAATQLSLPHGRGCGCCCSSAFVPGFLQLHAAAEGRVPLHAAAPAATRGASLHCSKHLLLQQQLSWPQLLLLLWLEIFPLREAFALWGVRTLPFIVRTLTAREWSCWLWHCLGFHSSSSNSSTWEQQQRKVAQQQPGIFGHLCRGFAA